MPVSKKFLTLYIYLPRWNRYFPTNFFLTFRGTNRSNYMTAHKYSTTNLTPRKKYVFKNVGSESTASLGLRSDV